MKKALIEGVAIEVSRIGFGTAGLHNTFSTKLRHNLLRAAINSGITHFDTAPYYGYGLAESDLGHVMNGRRIKYTLSTKVGLYPRGGISGNVYSLWCRKLGGKLFPKISQPNTDWAIDRARSSLYASLKRLKTDYIDFLFLHEPEFSSVGSDEMLYWLESEKVKGTIRAWGLAGIDGCVSPWMNLGHKLAQVVQTKDSIDHNEADFVHNMDRNLQFTYGYFSSARVRNPELSAQVVMRHALDRNTTGSILISSNSPVHIKELAKLAGG